jgi:hypothetical protein
MRSALNCRLRAQVGLRESAVISSSGGAGIRLRQQMRRVRLCCKNRYGQGHPGGAVASRRQASWSSSCSVIIATSAARRASSNEPSVSIPRRSRRLSRSSVTGSISNSLDLGATKSLRTPSSKPEICNRAPTRQLESKARAANRIMPCITILPTGTKCWSP